jgi:Tfp pilus assembly protein PilV
MKPPRHSRAFTLVEVMVAIAIFFMAMFAILGVMSSGVHAAAILRNSGPTAGMIAAQMSISNQLEVGSRSGTFSDIGIYEAYHWVYNCSEVTTNGLFQMDFVVVDPNGVQSSSLSTLFYRPDSKHGMGVH